MDTIISCLEQYGLLALEKQEKFDQLIGEHTMELDIDAGLIRFSNALEFPFQVLGTESDNTLTWLWAWAEEQSDVPEELLSSARDMREWGAREGVAECTMPSVDLNRADGQMLSLISSEICRASCYYHDAYEGGGLFLLLSGSAIDGQAPFTVESLSRRFAHLISFYDFDHLSALRAYFERKDLPFTEHGSFLVSRLESGEDVRANFDSAHRLVSINGKDILQS